ncbi:MAG: patatin-like phospholipase family protein [Pseudomonadota bacterium]
MSVLSLLAGPRARQRLRENGLRQEDVALLVGASGGPKWFVLYGMDRYLFGSFFRDRHLPLSTMGTSAGAWRLACLGLNDPAAGIERLAWRYATQTYSSSRPDRHEVSREARRLLDDVLGEDGAAEIAGNPLIRTHVIADRARAAVRSENRALLGAGLAACGLCNAFSRRTLRHFFERTVFVPGQQPPVIPLDDMPTHQVELRPDNVREALMATGSIPLVMEGVKGVPGATGSLFRDGGITDYHFDLPFSRLDDLVLYPHFYAGLIPGWFDKMVRWRRIDPANFDNVIVLAPSAEFVATLPFGKIPDRKDFEVLDTRRRIDYWTTVLKAGQALGDALQALVENGRGLDEVRPLPIDRVKHL